MSDGLSHSAKAARLVRTILNTSLSSCRITRGACQGVANQRWTEMVGLVHLVRALRPTAIMEIGMDKGGTMALWAQIASPNAHLIGLDIRILNGVDGHIRSGLRTGQKLSLVEADSHADSTKRTVIDILGGKKLDFLFIDGDHSYEGAKLDFDTYGPLVCAGGLVGFHDIVPDFSVRYGIQTSSNAGGVHKLWREVMSRFPHYEFIESIGQDGLGIGVVRM